MARNRKSRKGRFRRPDPRLANRKPRPHLRQKLTPIRLLLIILSVQLRDAESRRLTSFHQTGKTLCRSPSLLTPRAKRSIPNRESKGQDRKAVLAISVTIGQITAERPTFLTRIGQSRSASTTRSSLQTTNAILVR